MMNILIVSNNDACRSRMAMEILTSFGRGMKVFTAGVLPGNGIPDTVFSVMEQNGYHLSHKKPVDVELYCHQPWDYVVTLCREAEESRKDFNNVVRNWKHFLYNDPFQAYYNDEDLVEQQVAEVYDLMHRQLYEFYRDELSEQLLPRCRCGANTYCRCE